MSALCTLHLCKGKGLLFEGRKGISGWLTTDAQQGGSEPGTQQRRSGLLKLLLFREKGSDTAYWKLYRLATACVISIHILIYIYTCKHACTSRFGITHAFREQASQNYVQMNFTADGKKLKNPTKPQPLPSQSLGSWFAA